MRGYELKSEIVAEAGLLHLSGATVPLEFFQTIKYKNGKPDLVACLVLADILYWYRPIKMRDDETGQPTRWRQRFAGDKLHLNYESLGGKFGATERQARDACAKLKKLGLLTIEVRPVASGGSQTFFEPNLQMIADILKQHGRLTLERESEEDQGEDPTNATTGVGRLEPTHDRTLVEKPPTHARTLVGLRQNVSRVTSERESSFLHEITTEITTETTSSAGTVSSQQAPTAPVITAPSDHPESLHLFIDISGHEPGIYHQDQIVGTVQDLAIWEIVLREWRQGGYGWRSIGRLLTKYSERVRQQLPNTKASNGNGAHVGASTSKPVLEVHRSLSDQEILELADVFNDRPEGERSESETDIINQAARIRAINGNAPTRA